MRKNRYVIQIGTKGKQTCVPKLSYIYPTSNTQIFIINYKARKYLYQVNVPVHAMIAYMGRGSTASLTCTLGTRWRWVVSQHHVPAALPPEKEP